MSDRSILFNLDGQKEMKEFLLRIKNNLIDQGEQDREYSTPKFAQEVKIEKPNVVIEFDENLEFSQIKTRS